MQLEGYEGHLGGKNDNLLMQRDESRFAKLRLTNITTRVGDGSAGWKELAPFERIIITAAAQDIPPLLIEQLDIGGIMVVPVNDGRDEYDQRLLKVTKTIDGIETEELGITRFVPLVESDVQQN